MKVFLFLFVINFISNAQSNIHPNNDVVFSFPDGDERTCGFYRDPEIVNGCQQVGCTKIVTNQQERIAREAMGRMMERGHVSWHGRVDQMARPNQSEGRRERAGRSFLSMHANMLHIVQKALYTRGIPCMPGLHKPPRTLERFRSFTERSRSNQIMQPVRDRRGNILEAGSVSRYNEAYRQWVPYSLENMRGSNGSLRLVWTRSLGIFGANVQWSFHNNFHMALTELSKRDTNRDRLIDYRDISIDDLRYSEFATRNAYFWLIHGLVDYQINYYMFAHHRRVLKFASAEERNDYWNDRMVDRRLYGGIINRDSEVILMCHVMGSNSSSTCHQDNAFISIPMRHGHHDHMERSSESGPVVVSSSTESSMKIDLPDLNSKFETISDILQ